MQLASGLLVKAAMRFALACLILSLTTPAFPQVNVLTYQYGNTRAGANTIEVALTPGNVNSSAFGKLFSYPVDGYVYGQPLYVANVAVPGTGTHNAVFVATEHDSVYAFDADTQAGSNAAPLWHTSFVNAAAGVTSVPYGDTGCGQIEPEIGITGTPVIDASTGTLYLVAMTKETSGSAVSYVQRLHALDITTGLDKPGSPVTIQATFPGTGEGGTTLTFNPKNYKQRPGLLLLNGVVYTAWSSHCDIGAYHGWLIAYDAHSLAQGGRLQRNAERQPGIVLGGRRGSGRGQRGQHLYGLRQWDIRFLGERAGSWRELPQALGRRWHFRARFLHALQLRFAQFGRSRYRLGRRCADRGRGGEFRASAPDGGRGQRRPHLPSRPRQPGQTAVGLR
jgi:hypothetical protein